MYSCAMGIGVRLFLRFCFIGFRNCSDSMIFFVFHFIVSKSLLEVVEIAIFSHLLVAIRVLVHRFLHAQEWSLNASSESFFSHQTKIDVIAGNTLVRIIAIPSTNFIFVCQTTWCWWNVRHWTSGVNVHNENSNQ